jgi:hypothetical protein
MAHRRYSKSSGGRSFVLGPMHVCESWILAQSCTAGLGAKNESVCGTGKRWRGGQAGPYAGWRGQFRNSMLNCLKRLTTSAGMSIRVVGVSALPGKVFAAPVKARRVKRRTVMVKTGRVVFSSPQVNSGNLKVGGECRARYAGERRGDECQLLPE